MQPSPSLDRRHLLAPLLPISASLLCVILGLLTLALLGYPPGEVLHTVRTKVLFRADPALRLVAYGEILRQMVPILLTGLAVTVAFRASVWNIGGEGQFLLGAIVANILGATLPLPAAAAIPLLLLTSALAGALLAGLASVLEITRKVPVVLSTLLLNALMVGVLRYVILGPLGDPQTRITRPLLDAYTLPELPALRLHIGLFIALAAAALVGLLLRFTTFGFRLRMVGENPTAARFAGVNVPLTSLATLTLSGALAGLAGAIHVAGVRHELSFDDGALGFGFTGIAVALLGRLSAIGAVAAALFFALLQVALSALERDLGVPAAMSWALQGAIVVVMLVLTQPGIAERLGGPRRS